MQCILKLEHKLSEWTFNATHGEVQYKVSQGIAQNAISASLKPEQCNVKMLDNVWKIEYGMPVGQ